MIDSLSRIFKSIYSLRGWYIFLLPILMILGVIFASFVIVLFSDNVNSEGCLEGRISKFVDLCKKNEILIFLGIGMGSILFVLQVLIANRRATALEDTVMNAERGLRQERLKNAMEHLGHKSVSVRLGGAYELFHLAQDTKELHQTVMDILCAHIRRTTGEAEYREKHPSKPSEEVQSLLSLLFVQEHKVFEGCHINLQGSWLNGARLPQAHLQGANLAGTHLRGADLREACLHGVELRKTHLQRAILERARLHGSDLREAEMQVAKLYGAQLQGACLMDACLQGATLTSARLQGIHYDDSAMPFPEHIRYWIGKESMPYAAIFEGGLSQEDVDALVGGLFNEKAKKDLREKLTRHVGKPASHQLTKNSGAITGAYTEEEAEQWIAEYEKAMPGASKAGNER